MSDGPESAEEMTTLATMQRLAAPTRELPQPAGLSIRDVPEPVLHGQVHMRAQAEHEQRVREIGAPWLLPTNAVPEIVVEAIAAVTFDAVRSYERVCRGREDMQDWHGVVAAQRNTFREAVRAILTGRARCASEVRAAMAESLATPYRALPYDERRRYALILAMVQALGTPHV